MKPFHGMTPAGRVCTIIQYRVASTCSCSSSDKLPLGLECTCSGILSRCMVGSHPSLLSFVNAIEVTKQIIKSRSYRESVNNKPTYGASKWISLTYSRMPLWLPPLICMQNIFAVSCFQLWKWMWSIDMDHCIECGACSRKPYEYSVN